MGNDACDEWTDGITEGALRMTSPWVNPTPVDSTQTEDILNSEVYKAFADGPTPEMIEFEMQTINLAIKSGMPGPHIVFSFFRLIESMLMAIKCPPEQFRLLLDDIAANYAHKFPHIQERIKEFHKNQQSQEND
jgi:hypothetical protein